MLKNLILLLLLLPATLFAQVSLGGKVIGMVDKKAVPNASVFLNKTGVGGATLENGTFNLSNVRNGQYELLVKCVGFEPYSQTIQVNGSDITLPVIELMPKVTVLNEVKVQFDPNRQRHLEMLIAEFLGHSENARDCKILNPELLDMGYDSKTGTITASTNDFLIIENKALGYRIKYQLLSFELNPRAGTIAYSGQSIFEAMKGSASQEKRWQKNRITAYLGSDMHFFRACIANDVPEEGFIARRMIRTLNTNRPPDSLISARLEAIYHTSPNMAGYSDSLSYWRGKARMSKYNEELIKTPVNSLDYIRLTQRKGIYGITYKDCLVVTYKDTKSTIVTFKKPFAFFDENGIIMNPESALLEGYWGTHRIADLLPSDYQLPTTF